MSGKHPELRIEKREGYLEAVCPRYCCQEACANCIHRMFDALQSGNCSRLLIDYTATTDRIPVLDLYQLGCEVARLNKQKPSKVAVVAAREATYPDRFFETVVNNRSVHLRVFVDDFDEARTWLLEG